MCGFRRASATDRASGSRAKAASAAAARSPAICICDLYTHVTIPLTTAVLGGEADVLTLGGKSLRLKVPPTTQNAQVFRLKGHGMPVAGKLPGSDDPGDLYATVDVELPRELGAEQRKLFEELQKLGK